MTGSSASWSVSGPDIGDTTDLRDRRYIWAEWIFERFERPSFQIEKTFLWVHTTASTFVREASCFALFVAFVFPH